MVYPLPRGHTTPVRPASAGARLSLTLMIAAETVGFAALVRLGRSTPFDLPLDAATWQRADPVDALAAALRWTAMIADAWLLLVTVLCVAARAASSGPGRSGHGVSRIAHVAPRAIRCVVERAVVGSLAIGVVGLPSTAFAATHSDPPVVTIVRDGRAADLTSLPAAAPAAPSVPPDVDGEPAVPPPMPAVELAPVPSPDVPPRSAAAPPRGGEPRSVVVARGEHLWELAAREVARVHGIAREAVVGNDVARYWVLVCDANRDRLVSGDVNLVFVGESIVLPPLA